MATLYIFSGVPATGKTTLAAALARHLQAVYLRIDTIEQTLTEAGNDEVKSEGYEVAYRVAVDNLKLGLSVVADSCNSIVITRRAWEKVGADSGAPFFNIEIACSDPVEHRRRVETRTSTVPGLTAATWPQVEDRQYDTWKLDRIVIDTAGRTEQESLDELYRALGVA
jgi:predicted kinase